MCEGGDRQTDRHRGDAERERERAGEGGRERERGGGRGGGQILYALGMMIVAGPSGFPAGGELPRQQRLPGAGCLIVAENGWRGAGAV
jgi:hypothetical protein